MDKGAHLSHDRKYRYALWRRWDRRQEQVFFICLNPSTADETADDPTLRKCIRYASAWGFGGLWLGNLFAHRSTDPSELSRVADPVGRENDDWLIKMSRKTAIAVAAWGNHGGYLDRSCQVTSLLQNLHYLRLTKSGHPAHPLYLPGGLRPQPFSPSTI